MNEDLLSILGKIDENLIGRIISSSERKLLTNNFDIKQFPAELIEILSKYKIIGQIFSISDDRDPSGIGVEMKWFDPSDQIEEAYKCYPGRLVIKDDYLPIGMCLSGSGDPYFLKTIDQKYMVFRLPHDAIYEDNYDYDSAEFICLLHELFNNLSNLD